MANFTIKEMAHGMGNNKKGRIYPKMRVYSEFDYDKVVDLIHTYSPAFSKGTIRGVLDTLPMIMKTYLPLGHTLKIDNVGVFSLSLGFADSEAEAKTQQESSEKEVKTKYRRVQAKGVNFRVDKQLVTDINVGSTFDHLSTKLAKPSAFTPEERLQRALDLIDKNGHITLQEYANTNKLSRSTASRELAKLSADPNSGIEAKGNGPTKLWVRS